MNISPKTVESLRSQGWTISRVSELLPSNATDQEILELARREDMVVVSQDLDFSALLALGGYSRPSLVTLRLFTSDPESVTQALMKNLPKHEDSLRKGCAVTLEDFRARVRMLPIT
jgi:predicted nuclease of predicted toxin-antitoxin system